MPERPNIVVIMVDDLGWRDISCDGSSFYETPHVDSLAETGMLFSDAYAAAPVFTYTGELPQWEVSGSRRGHSIYWRPRGWKVV